MPDVLPDKLTQITKAEALSALYAGWCATFGEAPKNDDSLRVLMSQWALETGWGKAMHNYNFGNVKSTAGDGYDYCMFRCYEKINGKIIWYDPPDPATRFRAFRTAIDGAKDYLKILHKRFTLSWPAVLQGTPAAFSHALRQQGYYTADESAYTQTLTSIFNSLKSTKIDKSQAPAASADSGGGTSAGPAEAPAVSKNVTGGLGADAAQTALARSLSAHGWSLAGGHAWKLDDPAQAPDQFHSAKLLPGDIITIVTATGPRCGRVGTVLFADGEYADVGTVWLASASGPKQEVVIEKLALEASPRDFDASLKDAGKPVIAWRDSDKRPSIGHAWVVGFIRASRVQRSVVDGMTDAQRSQLKIEQGDAEVTPGTVLSRAAKQRPGDPTIRDVPFGDEPAAIKSSTPIGGTGAPAGASLTALDNDDIPPPIQIDSHTVQLRVGKHAGRIAFTVKKPGDPQPTAPAAGEATPAAPNAEGKRDTFIQAAMNLLGTPFLANSDDPAKGLDGVGLISIGLRRVGMLKKDAPPLTVDSLNGMLQQHGGTSEDIPADILPGDIAWFGKGTHDVPAQQHPMIYVGGSRVLGPIGDGGPKGGAVQIIHINDVPEHFAGWSQIEDLGTDTEHTEHPGNPPTSNAIASAAVLPAGPAPRYDALKAIMQAKGGTWLDGKGQVNLVGVKNMHERSVILPKEDDWNDTIFAAYLDDDGNKCCTELRASINPGTDKDSTGAWHMVDGPYTFKLADGDGVGTKALQPDGDVKGWFDEHGAGSIRPGDLKAAAEASAAGDGGGTSAAAPDGSSAGDSGSNAAAAGDGSNGTAGGDSNADAAAPAATTTAAPANTTTAAPAPSATTTAAPAHTTTAAPAKTTTAAAPAKTTTAAPAPTTTAAPPTTTTAAPKDKVTSSQITVAGKHFADWFNDDFKPQYPGNHPTIQLWKKPAPMFPSKVNKTNFNTVFDNVKYLWADQLTVPEFLGFFGIFYNETGGTMQPAGEVGGAKYMFEPTPGGKSSYNKAPNRLAGDQLKAAGVISSDDDVALWNGQSYPSDAPADVQAAAKECDFYKYRGHGFIQTTWRNNYQRDCDPALQAAGYSKTCEQMTTAELENAIKTDPKVNLAMVKSFFKAMAAKFAKVNQDPPVWYDTGRAVSGQKPYGDLYQWRCETIYAAMKKAGFELK